ncbi:hypothetical protein SAMN05216389_11013 [Oceanobacillus limi]|uniref:Uncharacterized protein n=1 Tax=Oceanobacillus limi TaxID=930131 RepID=A0A1I0DZD6_9BACI|nr:hypothetical protein SAMN05216389_11013 [Oceanobacillus limi]
MIDFIVGDGLCDATVSIYPLGNLCNIFVTTPLRKYITLSAGSR